MFHKIMRREMFYFPERKLKTLETAHTSDERIVDLNGLLKRKKSPNDDHPAS